MPSEPVDRDVCVPVVEGEVLVPQRNSCEGRHNLTRLGGEGSGEPLSDPDRARNSRDTSSEEIQIGSMSAITDPVELWGKIRTVGEAESIRILAEILVYREGRNLILGLEHKDAELCIEILDRVSRDPYPIPSFAVSDSFPRAP